MKWMKRACRKQERARPWHLHPNFCFAFIQFFWINFVGVPFFPFLNWAFCSVWRSRKETRNVLWKRHQDRREGQKHASGEIDWVTWRKEIDVRCVNRSMLPCRSSSPHCRQSKYGCSPNLRYLCCSKFEYQRYRKVGKYKVVSASSSVSVQFEYLHKPVFILQLPVTEIMAFGQIASGVEIHYHSWSWLVRTQHFHLKAELLKVILLSRANFLATQFCAWLSFFWWIKTWNWPCLILHFSFNGDSSHNSSPQMHCSKLTFLSRLPLQYVTWMASPQGFLCQQNLSFVW